MALPTSSLSNVCRSIAVFVHSSLAARGYAVRVLVGTPFTANQQSDAEHRLNLFFYRFEPFEFSADGAPGQTLWLRAQCVVTALAIDEGGVGAGENDLSLLGEVMRIFHEQPVMNPVDVGGEIVTAQLVQIPFSLDDINRLWSTQKDTNYRASVAYELSLLAVVPKQRTLGAPLVGAVGAEVRLDRAPQPFAGSVRTAPFLARHIDTDREDWAPQICFVEQDARAESLAYEVGSSALAAFVPVVAAAGALDEAVVLRWESWDKDGGWRTAGAPKEATIAVASLDSTSIPAQALVPFDLPSRHAGQALLYATRSYRRASDDALLQVRSNPLLVTLYGGPS